MIDLRLSGVALLPSLAALIMTMVSLLLVVTGGHIGLLPALLGCLVGACGLALVTVLGGGVQDGQPASGRGSGGDKELDEYASFATHY